MYHDIQPQISMSEQTTLFSTILNGRVGIE